MASLSDVVPQDPLRRAVGRGGGRTGGGGAPGGFGRRGALPNIYLLESQMNAAVPRVPPE